MKRLILNLLMLSVSAFVQAQAASGLSLVVAHGQKSFAADVPAGNFSGIAPLGDGLYAVVDDKKGDGFYVFRISFDARGDILSVSNLGFRGDSLRSCDAEGIVYVPSMKTVFISGEQDNKVVECNLAGQPTGRKLDIPDFFHKAKPNRGLESLAYNEHTHRFWTTSESPLMGDSLFILCCFNEELQLVNKVEYAMDAPIAEEVSGTYVHGISEMTALDDGSLLILEREVLVPEEKFGAWANCKLYHFSPGANPQKHIIHEWKTDISLFHQDFANYEGMCLGPRLEDGSQVILLIADSQHHYMDVLSDWFKTIVVRKVED